MGAEGRPVGEVSAMLMFTIVCLGMIALIVISSSAPWRGARGYALTSGKAAGKHDASLPGIP